MICSKCRAKSCEACLTANCGCRHVGSTVRPLTTAERHDHMLGLLSERVVPVGTPSLVPVHRRVIRVPANGGSISIRPLVEWPAAASDDTTG